MLSSEKLYKKNVSKRFIDIKWKRAIPFNEKEYLGLYLFLFFISEIIALGNLSITSSGLHPVGINQILNLSLKLLVLYASWITYQACWKFIKIGFHDFLVNQMEDC